MFGRLNIRHKLALVLWGSALLAFAMAGTGAALYQRLTLEGRARQVMEPYVQLVVVGTDAAVAFEDPVRAQEILDTLRANPQIIAAEIYLADGRLLARFSAKPDTKPSPHIERSQGIYLDTDKVEWQEPLSHGAQFHLYMGLEQLREQGRQILWMLGAGGLVLLAVTLGLLALLQRAIIRPITTLAEAAEGVRARADYDRRVPAAGDDEVAQLGRNFNAMMAAVREREDDLRQLSVFQRALLDNAAYAIISATADGIVTSHNPAAERLTGYSAAEVVGKATPQLWHDPEEMAQRARALSADLGEAVAPGFEVFAARARRNLIDENEWTFVRKDGTRVPVLLSVTALRGDNGLVTGFVGLVNDLSERKRAEQERLAHLCFLESMDRVNRAISGTNDLEQMLRDVLDVVLETFQCDRARLIYPCDPEAASWQVVMECTAPEYAGASALGPIPMNGERADLFRQVLEADGPVRLGPEGDHPCPVPAAEHDAIRSVMAAALSPKTGKPWEFQIHRCSVARIWRLDETRLFQEISRRLADGLTGLLAHRDLQDSREKLEEVQRIAHIGYWDRDFAADRITLCDEACRILGLPSQEYVLGLEPWHDRWLELIHPEDRPAAAQALADALQRGVPYNVEYRMVQSGGEVRFVHSEARVTRDESGQPRRMLGMLQDVTEYKRVEGEIRRLNQELEQRVRDRTAALEAANQELEAFAYSVSHDLRAPLRHVDGFIDLLRKCVGESLDGKGRHYMETISDSAQRMGRLIDDLLAFSRMGRSEMSRERVHLGTLVHEVVAELAPEAKSREVRWQVGELPAVRGDRTLLRAVFMNLLANALKFSRPREPAEIEVGWKPGERGETVIFVRDNGVGFDPAYVDNLFGVFQRLHRTEEFEGTGIGLANVRRIIARHGGRTWAEGGVDQGATFYFSLPQASEEA